jgi:hypothetical protein
VKLTIAFIALSALLSKSWVVECHVHLFIAMIEQWGQIPLIQIFATKHYATKGLASWFGCPQLPCINGNSIDDVLRAYHTAKLTGDEERRCIA